MKKKKWSIVSALPKSELIHMKTSTTLGTSSALKQEVLLSWALHFCRPCSPPLATAPSIRSTLHGHLKSIITLLHHTLGISDTELTGIHTQRLYGLLLWAILPELIMLWVWMPLDPKASQWEAISLECTEFHCAGWDLWTREIEGGFYPFITYISKLHHF